MNAGKITCQPLLTLMSSQISKSYFLLWNFLNDVFADFQCEQKNIDIFYKISFYFFHRRKSVFAMYSFEMKWD